ncbi:unnamed protein product [Prorocentrum cordatum]|nr:unnamed protein product [Polarella glacialis]
MRASPWSEGRRVPGSLVRRLQFSFPAPDNTPRMVQRLIGLPEWMDSSMLVRMKTTEDQLTLVMSTCSHNVPYGECSRIEDRLHFTPDAARGGVAVAKWIGLVWVKSLPWALGPAAGFLEKQVHDQAKETWGKFQAHLRACAS